MGLPISAVVLTHNEEVNIEECLRSLAWCSDVHVVDSGSSDRTVELAKGMGARVSHHPFESFGRQREWANRELPLRNDWVLHLDADERVTTALETELRELFVSEPTEVAFGLASKTIFDGVWLRHASRYPVFQTRLVRRSQSRFVDAGHGQAVETAGQVGRLEEPYEHFNFSKGIDDWIERHNRYSTREASEDQTVEFHEFAALFSKSVEERRRLMKRLFLRLPARAPVMFFYTYFVRGGFLDGRAGLNYAKMRMMYELMIDVKRWTGSGDEQQ